jgi:two-component system, chemotaxis family, sensor kinase CheA
VSNVVDENDNIFSEFLDDYFAECEEHLTNVQQQLLALEDYVDQPSIEANIVNQLFRSFHTIKGLSGMVGFKEVESLSHHMESYLKLLRDEEVILSPLGFDILLESVKLLEQLIITQKNKTDSPKIDFILNKLTQLIAEISPNPKPKSSVTPQKLRLTATQITTIDQLLEENYLYAWHFTFSPNPKLAENGINVNVIRSRLESLGKVIYTAPRMTENNDIVFDFIIMTNSPENTFTTWQNDGIVWTLYKEKSKSIISPEIKEEFYPELIIQKTNPVNEIIEGNISPLVDLSEDLLKPSELNSDSHATVSPNLTSQTSNVVRVDLAKLDDLIRMLGDLVISRAKLDENLKQAQNNLVASQRRTLQEINLTLERQMRDIREGIMRVRLVSIGEIFSRMQFVVRDLMRTSKKDINLDISGQNTEIDKLVVERMMDPMLHLVRNAVGHGIETKEERIKQGKPIKATVSLRAKTAGEMVMIEIEDDGKGIDRQRVLAKAQSVGLLEKIEGENLDNLGILDLLCHPGFSTQEKADRVSGRGVGMTVVKNTVNELGGVLELTTKEGKGTLFTIQLPLTLAIADALIIVVCNQRFAIPQSSIREIMYISDQEIITLENNEIMTYRGQVLPVRKLSKIFNLESQKLPINKNMNNVNIEGNNYLKVVVIGTQSNAIGLVIDQVIGMREIVVRSLIDPLVKVMGIAGATELGDGRVVLILDTNALIRSKNFKNADNHQDKHNLIKKELKNNTE